MKADYSHLTTLQCCSSFKSEISRMAVLGMPSSSCSSLIFFNAMVLPLTLSRALYTTAGSAARSRSSSHQIKKHRSDQQVQLWVQATPDRPCQSASNPGKHPFSRHSDKLGVFGVTLHLHTSLLRSSPPSRTAEKRRSLNPSRILGRHSNTQRCRRVSLSTFLNHCRS